MALRSAWPRARVYARTAASRARLRQRYNFGASSWLFNARRLWSVPPSFRREAKEAKKGRGGKFFEKPSDPRESPLASEPLFSLYGRREGRVCSPRRLPPVRAVTASRSEYAQRKEPLALCAGRRKMLVCISSVNSKKSLAHNLSLYPHHSRQTARASQSAVSVPSIPLVAISCVCHHHV